MSPKDRWYTGCVRIGLRCATFGLVPMGVAFLCAGCLYFNLFYNAQTSFDTSLKAQQALLKNNPDSSIVLPADVEA